GIDNRCPPSPDIEGKADRVVLQRLIRRCAFHRRKTLRWLELVFFDSGDAMCVRRFRAAADRATGITAASRGNRNVRRLSAGFWLFITAVLSGLISGEGNESAHDEENGNVKRCFGLAGHRDQLCMQLESGSR